MKNKFVVFLFAVLLPVGSIASTSVEEVQSWLEKMHRAAHMQNYEGTFVYGQNNQLSSMRIIHSATANGVRERLISMDGTGREVIRNGDTVTCILPDSNSVVVEKSRPATQFPPAFPMKVGQLSQYYSLRLDGKGEVAGQPTQKILIKPKDNLRYGHALWVHDNTGLLLKTYLLNEKGEPVEQFMFTQIKFVKTIPEILLKPSINSDKFTWYENKENTKPTTNKKIAWQVQKMPAGFKQDMQRKHKMSTIAMPVEHMVFSDGLASISVFIEKSKHDKSNLVGGSRMGAVNAHGRAFKNYHVTVMGEVPHATVKMIGESIRYIGHD